MLVHGPAICVGLARPGGKTYVPSNQNISDAGVREAFASWEEQTDHDVS